MLALLADLYGPAALEPDALRRARAGALDPFTQGYIAQWAPGDLTAVGPLHGTHEPPFYVAGSDHWVCGYMEGAVRTGRSGGVRAPRRAQRGDGERGRGREQQRGDRP